MQAKSSRTRGPLGAVTSVPRVHTEGGVAPSAGCGANTPGHAARVPYRADDRFFTRR